MRKEEIRKEGKKGRRHGGSIGERQGRPKAGRERDKGA